MACMSPSFVAAGTAAAARQATVGSGGSVHATSDETLVADAVPPSLEADPLLVPVLDAVGVPRLGVPRGCLIRLTNQLFRVYVTGVQVGRQHLVITESDTSGDPCMDFTYGRSFSTRMNAAGALL